MTALFSSEAAAVARARRLAGGDPWPWALAALALTASAIILAIVFGIAWLSFREGVPGATDGVFSLRNYRSFASDSRTAIAFANTMKFALTALAVSLICGLLFGLAPALRAPTRDLEQILRAGGRTVAGSWRHLHGSFVISEMALAVVLLVSAGILGRTLLRLSSVNPGVDVHNVLVTRVALSPAALADPDRIRAAWNDVMNRVRQVPGVESVAAVDTVPLREGNNQVPYWNSPALPPVKEQPLALSTSVTPDYLKVMGIPLLKGRFFDDQDRKGHEYVVVIDDVLAQRAFGSEDPVGKTLWLPGSGSPFSSGTDAADPARVIGVVGHVRYWGLAGDDQANSTTGVSLLTNAGSP